MRLTEEQKRANKVQRVLDRFKGLSIGKCVGEVASKLLAIRRIESIDRNGNLTCCSCGKVEVAAGHGFDGGHWIGRSRGSVVLDRRNINAQCVACNRFGTGATKAGYDEFMRRTYGQDVMDELRRKSSEIKQWTKDELAELYVQFSEELSKIERGTT